MSLRNITLAAALAAALLGLPATAPAQAASPQQATPVIAVVDPLSVANVVDQPQLRIVGVTKAAKSLEPQFERLKKRFQVRDRQEARHAARLRARSSPRNAPSSRPTPTPSASASCAGSSPTCRTSI